MGESSTSDGINPDKSANVILPKEPQSFIEDLAPILKEHNADLLDTGRIEVASFDNKDHMALTVVAMTEEIAKKAIAERDRFNMSLNGGTAPKGTFTLLKNANIDWTKTHLFWGDERPPRTDTPGETNYGAAFNGFLKDLLAARKIPPENIHTHDLKSIDYKNAAKEYSEKMREILGDSLSFDLMLLGGGGAKGTDAEGHTMGLMRGSPVFDIPNPDLVEVIDRQNIGPGYTMTPQILEKAKQIIVLLPDSKKIETTKELIKAERTGKDYPIGILNTVGKRRTIVMTDQPLSQLRPAA